jgi:hypothetical protein
MYLGENRFSLEKNKEFFQIFEKMKEQKNKNSDFLNEGPKFYAISANLKIKNNLLEEAI